MPPFNLYPLLLLLSLAGSIKPHPESSHEELVSFINDGFDHTVSPCDSFYDYVCGNHSSSSAELLQSSFSDNLLKLIRKDKKYPSVSSALLEQVDDCVQYSQNETFRNQTGQRFMENLLKHHMSGNETTDLFELFLKLIFHSQGLVYSIDISPTGLLAELDTYENKLTISVDSDYLIVNEDYVDKQIDLFWDFYLEMENLLNSTNSTALQITKIQSIMFAKTYRSIIENYNKYTTRKYLISIKNRFLRKAITNTVSHYFDEGVNVVYMNVSLDEDALIEMHQLFLKYPFEGEYFLKWKAISVASLLKNIIPVEVDQMKSNRVLQDICLINALNLDESKAIFNLYAANLLVRSKYSMTTLKDLMAVRMMVEFIRFQIRNSFMLTTWLKDSGEKLRIIDTLLNISKSIGLPDEVYNEESFSAEFFRFKGFSSNSDMIEKLTRIRISNTRLVRQLGSLSASKTYFESNAYFHHDTNNLQILYRRLLSPLYNENYPISYNYGLLGATIGHEFFHRFAPPHNPDNWWFHDAFDDSVDCYKNFYNSMCYNLTQSDNYDEEEMINLCADGNNDISENMPDVEGARAAFSTMKSILGTKKLKERAMPEFDFTNEQMFFIAGAQQWCDKKMNDHKHFSERLRDEDSHAAERVRVNAVAMQMKEFQEAFSCKSTDQLVINKEQMCYLLPSV